MNKLTAHVSQISVICYMLSDIYIYIYNIYNQGRGMMHIRAHWVNTYVDGFRAAHACFIPAV